MRIVVFRILGAAWLPILIDAVRPAQTYENLTIKDPLSALQKDVSGTADNGRKNFHKDSGGMVVPEPALDLMGEEVGNVGGVDWMNKCLQALWPKLRKAMSHFVQTWLTQYIKDELEGRILAPLKDSLALDVDMGSTPPTVVSASTHERGPEDNATAVRLHFGFVFDSDDVNVKVGLLGLEVDSNAFVLKSVRATGVLVAVLDQLIEEFPVAGGIGLHFLDPPDVDFDLTGLLAWGDWPGLRKIFRKCVDKIIALHLVMPHQVAVPLGTPEQGVDMMLLAHPPPMGKVKVIVKWARNLADSDPFPGFGHSDAYVVVMVGSSQWESSDKDGPDPVWSDGKHSEEHSFDFWDPHQSIKIRLWDKDHLKDDRLGHTQDIQIKDVAEYSGQSLQLLKKGKEAGTQGTVTLEFEVIENS